jgi:hypothetical protein
MKLPHLVTLARTARRSPARTLPNSPSARRLPTWIYFMYCNYLKRLGTRQTKHLYLLQVSGPHFNILARRYGYGNTCFVLGELTPEYWNLSTTVILHILACACSHVGNIFFSHVIVNVITEWMGSELWAPKTCAETKEGFRAADINRAADTNADLELPIQMPIICLKYLVGKIMHLSVRLPKLSWYINLWMALQQITSPKCLLIAVTLQIIRWETPPAN